MRTADALSVLSVAFGFFWFAWLTSHKADYPNGGTMPIDLILWIFNAPLFICAYVWLSYRVGLTHGERYLAFEARHPRLKGASIYLLALAFAVLFGITVGVFSFL
jgi:hypothetical protein